MSLLRGRMPWRAICSQRELKSTYSVSLARSLTFVRLRLAEGSEVEFSLIERMVCPYCGGRLVVTSRLVADTVRLRYGLVKCHCFEFPVVNGVLLLSLSKGYGGAEEAMQPYVALQVAAIHCLERGDLPRLTAWIRRHAPLLAMLIEGSDDDYLSFAAKVAAVHQVHSEQYLREQARFEFLGFAAKGRVSWRQRLRATVKHGLRRLGLVRLDLERQLTGFYGSRFFSPRTQSLALQVGAMDLGGHLLSLCGGHGVFENMLAALGKTDGVVTVDGQLLNLFVIQRYVHPTANLICHDVQFPLPFTDGFFDGVFSSTCLPEIPAQRSFISEAMRVTRSSGWTWFDSIWNTASGVRRVDPMRDYRFCQNFFDDLSHYAELIAQFISPPRVLAASAPQAPQAYVQKAVWHAGASSVERALAECTDAMIAFLVASPTTIGKLGAPCTELPFPPERLSVSPAYQFSHLDAATIVLRRRSGMEKLGHYMASPDFPGYLPEVQVDRLRLADPAYLLDLYCKGVVSLLPGEFWRASPPLRHYLPGCSPASAAEASAAGSWASV